MKAEGRRWIILSTDGRYVTLGRASDPSEEEIRASGAALRAQGLAGWLAVMEGDPYGGPDPRLLEVRPLGDPTVTFADAAAACIRCIAKRRTELSH